MANHEIKLTWLDSAGDAAYIGNDETVKVDADSVTEACAEALSAAMHRFADDWDTGKYSIAAECGDYYTSVDFVGLGDE